MAVGSPVPMPGMQDLDELVRHARTVGADGSLAVHGSGSVSTKTTTHDHLGRERSTIYVTGAGVDLAAVARQDLVALYLDEVQSLAGRAELDDDEMAVFVARCRADGGPTPPSDALLHALVPYRHVAHLQPNSIRALSRSPEAGSLVREVLGSEVAFVPSVPSGHSLAKLVAGLSDHSAVVVAQHGLVTWGATSDEVLSRVLELNSLAAAYLVTLTGGAFEAPGQRDIAAAEVEGMLLRIRGAVSGARRRVLTLDRSGRQFADRPDVDAIAGEATIAAGRLTSGGATVVRSGADVDTATSSSVFLVPGLGTVAAADTHREAKIVAQVAWHAHQASAQSRSAFDEPAQISTREPQRWPDETGAPARPDLQGRIYIVTGAASGIGRDVAVRLAEAGAELVLGDVNPEGLEETAKEIESNWGTTAICVPGDLTDESVVEQLVTATIHTFGGIDGLVSNAGVGAPGRIADLSRAEWQRSMDINATSHFLVTRRLLPVLEKQGLGGSLVYIASKNALSPGAGFGAYSAAKAAQVQFARVVALEGAAFGVRSNVVNPDAVFEGSRLWSDELREQRAASHGVATDDLEDFYTQRNLLKLKVHGSDVALAVEFLLSDKSSRTTGCLLNVDGGVAPAFPR